MDSFSAAGFLVQIPDGPRKSGMPESASPRPSRLGPAVTIADGTRAGPGDLIICTRNDHTTEAGEPGRTLANGDLLRIEAITGGGLLVRRALDADPGNGQRRWTDRRFLFNSCGNSSSGTRSPTTRPRAAP